jgi:hypothetical protein
MKPVTDSVVLKSRLESYSRAFTLFEERHVNNGEFASNFKHSLKMKHEDSQSDEDMIRHSQALSLKSLKEAVN